MKNADFGLLAVLGGSERFWTVSYGCGSILGGYMVHKKSSTRGIGGVGEVFRVLRVFFDVILGLPRRKDGFF